MGEPARPPAVLILTDSKDAHADAVVRVIEKRDVPVVRLDHDRTDDWSFSFHNGRILIETAQAQFDDDGVGAIWIRRSPDAGDYRPSSKSVPAEFAEFVALQRFATMGNCLSVLETRVRTLNPLAAAQRAHAKELQWTVARGLGLRVPESYTGSGPQAARRFVASVQRMGRRICTKPVVGSFVTVDGMPHSRMTELLDDDDVAHLDSIAECPIMMQEYLEKAYEVRATVVGDACYAARIDSQAAGGATSIDWRNYNIPRTPHGVETLPDEIIARLVRLNRALGLVFSCCDLVRTKDGAYGFLEANAYGQWLWIEDLTGLPITAAVADMLVQWARSRR